jgi:Flp pilus assembly pilin Flp
MVTGKRAGRCDFSVRPHSALTSPIGRLFADDSAQGLVEYALIIALVSVVAIAALQALGKKASNTLSNAAKFLS